jgi:hypothetical protein
MKKKLIAGILTSLIVGGLFVILSDKDATFVFLLIAGILSWLFLFYVIFESIKEKL